MITPILRLLIIPVFLLTLPGLAYSSENLPELTITDMVIGDGETAVKSARIAVHYTGWLDDGTKFDSSVDRGEPFEFTLGVGQVIPGWDQGVAGMQVGGKRQLVIPPHLGYGENGAGDIIPPNATLVFDVELISVIPPNFTNIDNDELKRLLSQGVKIVDLRREDEWAETGIIEGSKKLTAFNKKGNFVRTFPSDMMAFAGHEEPVILICRVGNRSAVIADLMTKQGGYKTVYNVSKGIMGWIDSGNPVVR